MLIAHAPTGYLVGALVESRGGGRRSLPPVGIAASLLPDADMFWFYFVDQGRVHHHGYVLHWPLFWAVVCGVAVVWTKFRRPGWTPMVLVASASLGLHMIADTVAAPMYWLAPFGDAATELVHVPARYADWRLSFILHWTFAIEVAIWIAASATYLARNGYGQRGKSIAARSRIGFAEGQYSIPDDFDRQNAQEIAALFGGEPDGGSKS